MTTKEPTPLITSSSSTAQTPSSPHLPYPFINIPGISNLRTISSLPISSSSSSSSSSSPALVLRSGIIYRGPDLGTLPPSSISKLQELKITTLFDLRSPGQIARQGGLSPLPSFIKRIPCQIFTDSQSSKTKSAERYLLYSAEGTEGIVRAFEEILRSAGGAIRMILTHVASLKVEEENDVEEENKEAFLISCTTGNNRTGCLIAIILSLLGVSGPDISTEYELSTLGLEHKRKDVARRLVRNAPAAFGIGESPNEEIVRLALQRAERVAMARKESMEAMLLMVREKWGSVDGYARDVVGLDPNESGGIVERCREVMCVNASSVKKNRG